MQDETQPQSRLPGFYTLPAPERKAVISRQALLSDLESECLAKDGALGQELSDTFIENSIGSFELPLGIATNFRINQADVLVPMAVEESSVVAAASHGAKLARAGGGFTAASTEPVMTGQIQIFNKNNTLVAQRLKEHRSSLIEIANRGQERLISRGGGVRDMSWRHIPEINSTIVHLQIDTRDAMGANIVNTICEKVAALLPPLLGDVGIGLRILTNLSDRRLAWAECAIPSSAFKSDVYSGQEVIERIESAWQFAWHDVYRATTHNKGVMNGIDPVVIATGNDWRAVEAGAHAFCCRDGAYRPMTTWKVDGESLLGRIELPMAVGTVGGVTKLHPLARIALKIMGYPTASKLAEIICAVGLAQNLSALRALATEGIQHGHMLLHQKNLTLQLADQKAMN